MTRAPVLESQGLSLRLVDDSVKRVLQDSTGGTKVSGAPAARGNAARSREPNEHTPTVLMCTRPAEGDPLGARLAPEDPLGARLAQRRKARIIVRARLRATFEIGRASCRERG